MALPHPSMMFCVTACILAWASFSLAIAAASDANNPVMWPDYARDSKKNTNTTVQTMQTSIPLTYFETITDVLSISISGYVSFGAEYPGAVPPLSNWPFAPKIMAVYWTNNSTFLNPNPLPTMYTLRDDFRLSSVTNESSLIQYVKKVIAQPDFEPLLAFAVTWENVRPLSSDLYPNDVATFQLLLATDSQVTYAVRSYQKVWQSPSLSPLTYCAGAYSLGNGARPNCTTPGNQTGPEVIRLGTMTPTKGPYNCVQKALAATTNLNSSIYAVPPCPCYQKQAARDPQFNMSYNYPNCYQSVSPPPGGSLLQLCCYNQYGILVNLTKEARVPQSANSSDRSLQEAYETCCINGSGLCRWFLLKINRPMCVNNMTLLNAMELPSFTNTSSGFTYKVSPSKSMTFVYNFTSSTNMAVYSASGIFNSTHGFSLDRSGFSWYVSKGLSELRKLSYPQQLTFYMTDTYNLSAVSGFSWYVSKGLSELRKLSYPQQLSFYMTDTYNLSAAYAPLFMLCLCEQIDQCNDNSFPIRFDATGETAGFIGLDRYDKGNVNMMLCTCKGKSTGRFCEKPVNTCDDCLIRERSTCSGIPQNYCPACPSGYTRDGSQCRDSSSGGGGNINYSITTTLMFLLIIISFISSFPPWL